MEARLRSRVVAVPKAIKSAHEACDCCECRECEGCRHCRHSRQNRGNPHRDNQHREHHDHHRHDCCDCGCQDRFGGPCRRVIVCEPYGCGYNGFVYGPPTVCTAEGYGYCNLGLQRAAQLGVAAAELQYAAQRRPAPICRGGYGYD